MHSAYSLFVFLFAAVLSFRASVSFETRHVLAGDGGDDAIPHHGRCEPITVPLCRNLQYNRTIMPNILNHANQEAAGLEVHQYFPLVKIDCYKDLKFFLCTVYTPVCTILETPIPPCRSLCDAAKIGCEKFMTRFGFPWPKALDCDKFPTYGTQLCVGPSNHTNQINSSPNSGFAFKDAFNISNGQGKASASNKPLNVTRSLAFICPLQLQTAPDLETVFRLNGKDHKNCGAPCHGVLFDDEHERYLRLWITIWSSFCFLSSLFVVFSFLIDTRRFNFPERPIIYLSLCYCLTGLSYLIAHFLDNAIACNEPNMPPIRQANVQTLATVAHGKRESCSLTFMFVYFFSSASSSWWFILTLTWFLAAGLKWSPEAIENNASYFHIIAWAIPGILTIVALISGHVAGDPLSGVCSINFWTPSAQEIFIVYPLMVYLILGFCLLLAGFVSIMKIRTIMKKGGTKTDKLEKLMLRIGCFSIVYIIPTITLIGCYVYEKTHLDDWMTSWQQDACKRRELGIACPLINGAQPQRPLFGVFLIKYAAMFFVGVWSGLWVCSEKTLHSWIIFFSSRHQRNERYPHPTSPDRATYI